MKNFLVVMLLFFSTTIYNASELDECNLVGENYVFSCKENKLIDTSLKKERETSDTMVSFVIAFGIIILTYASNKKKD